MAKTSCDGCGRTVTVAGGIANFWNFSSIPSTAISLELADGSDHLLCFACVENLPEEATAADVAALTFDPDVDDRGAPVDADGDAEDDGDADGEGE